MSPPAANALPPAPMITMTFIVSLTAHLLSVASIARTISMLIAFSAFGRFSVISPTLPRSSKTISWLMPYSSHRPKVCGR